MVLVSLNYLERQAAVDQGVDLSLRSIQTGPTWCIKNVSAYRSHRSPNLPLPLAVYAIAQAGKAILPRDVGGPWGKRVKVSLGGKLGTTALTVGAYVTGRVKSTDWLRYSLVVLNCEQRFPLFSQTFK